MTAALANIVRVTTATTGTGTLTLGSAVSGFKAPPAGLDGLTVTYCIEEPGTSPTAREIGRGVYSVSGGTLTRASVLASTNADALISLSSGAAHVFITAAAEDFAAFTADSGSGGIIGLVPAPGAGDAALVKSLMANGLWGQPGPVKLASVTASNSATVSFTGLSSTYSKYVVEIKGLIPVTTNTKLFIRTSENNGSSYDSGSTDYHYVYSTFPDTLPTVLTGSGGAAQMQVDDGIGVSSGDSDAFVVEVFNSGVALKAALLWRSTRVSSGALRVGYGGGSRSAVTAGINAIQFLMSSGNISSGVFTLYGYP